MRTPCTATSRCNSEDLAQSKTNFFFSSFLKIVRSFGLQDDGTPRDMGRVPTDSASLLYVCISILSIPIMCKSELPLYGRDTAGGEVA